MLLPGPPKEMQPMFRKYGRAFLLEKLGQQERIESRVLRFFGIGESELETRIQDLIDQQSNPTIAPLAGDGEVTLRLTAKHRSEAEAKKLLDETEKKIVERVGAYLYGYNEETLFEKVIQTLKAQKKTVAAAESLTGGLFLEQLTAVPGASQVVRGGVICYTNDVKEKVLGVPHSVLTADGAVSERCARLLAKNVRTLCHADIGISFTGVAGPAPLEGKPVGTVYIGISTSDNRTDVYPLTLSGQRDAIRARTAKYGCSFLLKALTATDEV
jgi:nicotinamide-nucleotide amidase